MTTPRSEAADLLEELVVRSWQLGEHDPPRVEIRRAAERAAPKFAAVLDAGGAPSVRIDRVAGRLMIFVGEAKPDA